MGLLKFWNRPTQRRRELLLQQLEERIVLDAALNPAVKENTEAATDMGSQVKDQTAPVEGMPVAPSPGSSSTAPPPIPENLNQVYGQNLSMVLVSNALGDIKAITDAAEATDAKVIVFDAAQDHLSDIIGAIHEVADAADAKVGALAVFSHGVEGVLSLGADNIDFFSLAQYKSEFQALAQDLSDDAQIQFYTCSTAGNVFGEALLERIALYTGADVFASENITGGASGDWILEYSSDPSVLMSEVIGADALDNIASELVDVRVITNSPLNPDLFTNLDGALYFVGGDTDHPLDYSDFENIANEEYVGQQLWMTDGETATLIYDFFNGSDNTAPGDLTVYDGKLYFAAGDAENGRELWVSDGSTAGTHVLLDFFDGSGSSNPDNLTVFNGELYFTADYFDGTEHTGIELFKTSGSIETTTLVADINVGSGNSSPAQFYEFNDNLYFAADNGTDGVELYRTWLGTGGVNDWEMVQNIASGATGSDPHGFMAFGGHLYFAAWTADNGTELWRTDGSGDGAELVMDINPGVSSSDPASLTVYNGQLYFTATDKAGQTVHGREIWRTSGTEITTQYVTDLTDFGSEDSNPEYLLVAGDYLYFSATDDDGSTRGLYFLNTDNESTRVNGLIDGPLDPSDFAILGDSLFFAASDGDYDYELWTTMVGDQIAGLAKDIFNGTGESSYPYLLKVINNALYFSALEDPTDFANNVLWTLNNTAPELTQTEIELPAIIEDAGPLGGNLVEDLLNLLDPAPYDDEGDPLGIAVIGADTDNGSWQYYANDEWTQMNDPGLGTAILLSSADKIRFVPEANFTGSSQIEFLAWDQTQGASGDIWNIVAQGGITAFSLNSATATIDVTAINDAPVNMIPGIQVTGEDTALVFNEANSNKISISDVEGGNADGQLQVKLTSTNGRITLGAKTGLTFSSGDGTYDSTMTFKGTLANINTALDGLQFIPTANYSGPASIKVVTNDLDATGGGAQSDSDTINITVNAVNDAPVNHVPTAIQNAVEDGPDVTFNSTNGNRIWVSDVDSGTVDKPLTVTLSVDEGSGLITLSGVVGLTFEDSTSNVSDYMKFTGTSAAINTALNGMKFNPGNNINGDITLTVETSDSGTAVSSDVTVRVAAVNDAPVAVADTFTAMEDTPLEVIVAEGVLANDTDLDGDALKALLVEGPENGTLALNEDGSFIYTPDANFNGQDSFTYKVNDGTIDGNTVTVELTVEADNDAPVANTDSYTTDEDTALNVNALLGVVANDTDVEGSSLTATLVAGPANGSLTLNADGSFSYTPTANWHGSDSFTYQVSDGTALSNTGTVNITVNALNDAPVANTDSYTTDEDTALNVNALLGVVANDTDVEGSSLTATLVAGPANGSLTLNADGSFSYTPTANWHGSDSFTYQVSDGTALSNTGTVNITVNALNDAPVANTEAYNIQQDGELIVSWEDGVLANDTDVDSGALTAAIVTGPANGSLTLNADGSFTYTPDEGYSGPDSFTYKANDGSADSAETTVNITVTPLIEDLVVNEDADPVLIELADIFDYLGDELTYTVEDNSNDSLVYADVDVNGVLTLIFASDGNGDADITVSATNGVDTATDTFTVTVKPVNDAPVGVADNYSVSEDGTKTIVAPGVLANDGDEEGSPLTARRVNDVDHGDLTFNADGSFTYTPDHNFFGTDTFTYKVNDGELDSAETTVTLTVDPVNDNPTVVEDGIPNIIVQEDADPSVINLADYFSDVEDTGAGMTYTVVGNTGEGLFDTVTVNGSILTLTYAEDANGAAEITVRATDTGFGNLWVENTFTVTVNAVNDAPVALADDYETAEDIPLVVNAADGVLSNDVDVDADAITAVLVDGPENGTLSLNEDGSFTYTPDENYNGPDSFTYKVNDGTVDGNTVTVSLTVTAENDLPVAVADAYETAEDIPLVVNAADGVLSNDGDVDADPITAVLVDGPENGTLSLNEDGSFTYTPDENYNGPDSFTYKVNDGTVDGNTVTVALTVTAENDAPVVQDGNVVTAEDTPILMERTAYDVDGDALTPILVTPPSHGFLTPGPDGVTYTPALNYNGPDSFTYKVNDGQLDSEIATVNITVTPVNDAPVAVDQDLETDEDTPLLIPRASYDVDNDTIVPTIVDGPEHGTVTPTPDGPVYTPNPDFNGTDSFTFTMSDGQATSNIGIITITVDPVNDLPEAVEDAYVTAEDIPLVVNAADGVLSNDGDVDADPITAVLVDGPENGTLSLNGNGSFTYTPDANFYGQDSFTYKANDGELDSAETTVTLTVDPVNDNPTVVEDGIPNIIVQEDADPSVINLADYFSDVEDTGAGMTYTVVGNTGEGLFDTVTVNGSILTLTYAEDANGAAEITVRATDTGFGNLWVENTFTVTVNAVNDAPVALDDDYVTAEDTPLVIPVANNDFDAEGDQLIAEFVSNPSHGRIWFFGDGSINYAPDQDWSGTDSFSYRVSDGNTFSNVATVEVTVSEVSDAPEFNPLDQTFGTDGIVSTDGWNGWGANSSVALQSDGKVVVAGSDGFDFVLSRFNSDGSEDLSFGDGGHVHTDVAGAGFMDNTMSVAIQTDGKIVVSGWTDSDTKDAVLARYNSDGTLDESFGVDGVVITNVGFYDILSSIAFQSDGKIVAAGWTTISGHQEALVARYNADGSPDQDFSENGVLTLYFGNDTAASDVKLQSDGKIVVAARSLSNDIGVVRLTAEGVLDETFGEGGKQLTDVPDVDGIAFTWTGNEYLALQPDGKIVLATTGATETGDKFLVARYDTNGVLDSSFGIQLTDIGNGAVSNHASAVGIQADGKIVVMGNASYTFEGNTHGYYKADPAIARYNVDGSLDSAFWGGGTLTTEMAGSVQSETYSMALQPDGKIIGVGYNEMWRYDSQVIQYVENSGPQVIDNSVTITDPDSANMVSATVRISGNYEATEDSLGIDPEFLAPGVLSDWDQDSGILTLTGNSSTENYQSMLEHVTYTNTSENPDPDPRLVSWTVYDGALTSEPQIATIMIQRVNDAPVALDGVFQTAEDTVLAGATVEVLGDDFDADGDVLTAVLVDGPLHGEVMLSPNGFFSYTPSENYNGEDFFTYYASDGTDNSNIATVTIEVTPVNDAPVVQDGNVVTAEDTPILMERTAYDVDGDALTPILVTPPSHGFLTPGPDGVTYTPALNYNGPDSFTYKVNDGQLDSEIATVNITVTPVNDAPVAVDQDLETDEDTPLLIPRASYDVDNDPIVPTIVDGPDHGTVTPTPDGPVYTPNPDFNGTDSFTFTMSDGQATSNIGIITITVDPVNDLPEAVEDAYVTAEDTPLEIQANGVLANDTDLDGDVITAVLVDGPENGTLSLNEDGSFTYTPDENYNGPDSFTYKVNDGTVDGNTVTVALTVTPVNDAPEVQDLALTTDQGVPVLVELIGMDLDGDDLLVSVVTGPAHGTLSGSGLELTYTPNLGYFGTDSFTYKVNDGSMDSETATVNISVIKINNEAPVATGDSYSTAEDTALVVNAAAGLLHNDTDADGDPLSANLITGPAHGSLTLNADGSFTYTPAMNYSGADSFTYKASDGRDLSNAATVNLTVTPVNDAPTANADWYSTGEDVTLTVGAATGLLANDTDVEGNSLTASVVTGPAHGSVTLNADGSFSYTPSANYSGADSFTYKVNDGSANSSAATVNITVDNLNDAPVNTVPGAQSMLYTGMLTFSSASGTLLAISDADAGSHDVRVTLTSAGGYMTLFGAAPGVTPSGLTFSVGDGYQDTSMTFTGTISNINAALNGLVYKPTILAGTGSIAIFTEDLNNPEYSGSGGALSDTDTVSITIKRR